MKKRYIVGSALAVIAVIAAIAGGSHNSTSGAAKEASSASTSEAVPAPPAAEVTAALLSSAFQENEARAKLKYDDKDLRVTGKVKNVDLDLTDNPVIVLRGSGEIQGMGVSQDGKMTDVRVNGLSKEDAAAINKGQTITFACHGVDEVLGSPQLSSCTKV